MEVFVSHEAGKEVTKALKKAGLDFKPEMLKPWVEEERGAIYILKADVLKKLFQKGQELDSQFLDSSEPQQRKLLSEYFSQIETDRLVNAYKEAKRNYKSFSVFSGPYQPFRQYYFTGTKTVIENTHALAREAERDLGRKRE